MTGYLISGKGAWKLARSCCGLDAQISSLTPTVELESFPSQPLKTDLKIPNIPEAKKGFILFFRHGNGNPGRSHDSQTSQAKSLHYSKLSSSQADMT